MAGIFISYRRDDVAGQVGRLFGRLAAHYGEDFIFMDVESIRPSQQFESVIRDRIKDCDVMLVAIGPRWEAEWTESKGSKDFVRLELEAALAAGRSLCPVLIDRRDPPEAVALPEEFRRILDCQLSEIRHSTFDSDVERLIAGLEKQSIRPPSSVGRRRVEDALVAAGWAYSWLGNTSRRLTPPGVAALAAVVLVATGWAAYARGHARGDAQGYQRARDSAAADCDSKVQATVEDYEGVIHKIDRENLRITGLITDGTKGIEDAEVTLTNRSNNLKVSDKTDSRGMYIVDLEMLEVAQDDVIRFEVTKPSFRPTVESIKYYDGFREFRAVLRK